MFGGIINLQEQDRIELCKLLSIRTKSDKFTVKNITNKIIKDIYNFIKINELYNYDVNKYTLDELYNTLIEKKQILHEIYLSTYYTIPEFDYFLTYNFNQDEKRIEYIIHNLILSLIINKINRLNNISNVELESQNIPNYYYYTDLFDAKYIYYVMLYEWLFGYHLKCSQLKILMV